MSNYRTTANDVLWGRHPEVRTYGRAAYPDAAFFVL